VVVVVAVIVYFDLQLVLEIIYCFLEDRLVLFDDKTGELSTLLAEDRENHVVL
jgi:hypothetical protein